MSRHIEELRADVKSAEGARDKTRAQMVRLARELARMRQEERERSQREMEKLKVEYLARENRYVVDGERATLRDIRRQLDTLMTAPDVNVAAAPAVGDENAGRTTVVTTSTCEVRDAVSERRE